MDGMFPTFIWYSSEGSRFVVIGLYQPPVLDGYGKEWFATNYQSIAMILGQAKTFNRSSEALQDILENISLSKAVKVELRQIAENGIQLNTLCVDENIEENLSLSLTEAATSLNSSWNASDDIPF